jgi:hypothetical protein
VAAVIGKARILGFDGTNTTSKLDYSTCNSLQEIGCKLLQSIGFSSPDDASIQQAIELNHTFVAGLERIRDAAQRLTIEQQP